MAVQTSCAAFSGTGVRCNPDVVSDAQGRERVQHGSTLFPIACYAEDLST